MRHIRLPLEYLAQSPRIPYVTRKVGGLREVRRCRVGLVDDDAAARYERANQQRLVVGFARGGQGRVHILSDPAVSNEPDHESRSALSASALHACCGDVRVRSRVVSESGVDPGQPFADAALPEPQRTAGTRQAPKPLWSRRSQGSIRMRRAGCPFLPTPAPRVAHGRWSPEHRVAPPLTSNDRGAVRAHRRLRPTRRVSPAHTDARSPVAGTELGQRCFRRRPATCRRAG